ncbi:hypothetical protein FJTKL_01211 [Diaporthe vaccinii]|uniref:Uncharacterized protein n=1 Tax=Diaporthe vaccinii TaxID=105482 RepID=A0ABR4F5G4_9PEZI
MLPFVSAIANASDAKLSASRDVSSSSNFFIAQEATLLNYNIAGFGFGVTPASIGFLVANNYLNIFAVHFNTSTRTQHHDDHQASTTTVFSVAMRTIIPFIVIVKMLISAAGEGVNWTGQVNFPETESPTDDDQDYSKCVPQPEGFGPRPAEDTPSAFRRSKYFHDALRYALSPRGYKLASQDLDGAMENDLSFLGTHLLKHYDTDECARFCNDMPKCASFNLYFERDPVYEPNMTAGCPNPPSTTNINCVLWHSHLYADEFINFGVTRENFQVIITGSNIYNKIHGPLDLSELGFSGPRVDVDNDAGFLVPDEPTGDYSTP